MPLAGKTGTAQVNGKADTSLFASFGPVGAPQYAIVAVLEQSGFGADAAAPVVRHVWETVTGQSQTQVAPSRPGSSADGRHRQPGSASWGGRDRSRRDLSAPVAPRRPRAAGVHRVHLAAGHVTVFSATRGNAGPPNHSYLIKQTLFVVLGFGAMVVTASIDYRKYRDWLVPIYAFMVLFLAAGRLAAGVQRQRGAVLVRVRRLPDPAVGDLQGRC